MKIAFMVLMLLNIFDTQILKDKFIEKFKIEIENLENINTIKISSIKTFITNFLLINKNEDKNMILHIVEDYYKDFRDNFIKDKKLFQVLELLDNKKILNYFENWKINMHNIILEFYEIEKDDKFRDIMKKNPDNYGLSYEAYQIIMK